MAKRSTHRKPTKEPPRFDETYAKLQAIVDRLEEGALGLEESLAEFEAGIGLLKTCARILDEADRRIEVLTGFDAEGEPRTKPFDAAATHAEPTANDDEPEAAAGDSGSVGGALFR